MLDPLTEVEARVVGSLVEKQLTTPEYYPLTMNALTAACNQKSNRDPVMSLNETAIMAAVDALRDKNLVYLFYGSGSRTVKYKHMLPLRDKNLVYLFYGSGSRTVKYKHMLPSVYDLDAAGVAILAVLLLRGSQTIGELRERTGRLHEFAGLGEVQETLDALIRRDDPIVTKLERQPGQKEARYAHLLSGEVHQESIAPSRGGAITSPRTGNERIENLEREVETLRSELTSFRAAFDEFRKQFD